jgi:hypothetical protein
MTIPDKISIGRFTVKKQEIAENILERYRSELFNHGKFDQIKLENEEFSVNNFQCQLEVSNLNT